MSLLSTEHLWQTYRSDLLEKIGNVVQFTGTENYIASDSLKLAVNAAITLEKPLLIKGEPGTGKTMLAEELAKALDTELIQWHIKSTTKAQQGLYEYDAVSRLRDSQLGDDRVHDISNYIVKGKLWQAFTAEQRPILLIDEIDKADIEFPNDLLLELDKMEFYVYETQEVVKANFPTPEEMASIIDVHHPNIKQELVQTALSVFFNLREVNGLRKKPSTSELIDWLKLLLAEDINAKTLHDKTHKGGLMPLFGALLKNEQDVSLLEKLAFMAKRG